MLHLLCFILFINYFEYLNYSFDNANIFLPKSGKKGAGPIDQTFDFALFS